jgi:serine phosphatase RsbU (regulator of sigma subunit)
LFFSSISIVAVTINVIYFNKKEKISHYINNLDEINVLCLLNFKIQQEFLNYEKFNPIYFKTNKSVILEKNAMLKKMVLNKCLLIKKNDLEISDNFNINQIYNLYLLNSKIFNEVVKNIKQRGYKDFGVEGSMRKYAHELMNNEKDLKQIIILSLRRNEKDFIIRKELQYVVKFNELINELKFDILDNTKISTNRKEYLLNIVSNYDLAFKKLVSIELKLGTYKNKELIYKLKKNSEELQNYFNHQKIKSLKDGNVLLIKIKNILYFSYLIIIITFLFLSYYFAKRITKPLSNLSASINQYANSEFKYFPIKYDKSDGFEISMIKESFSLMSQEISQYINFFKEKVEERTSEITKQKNKLLHQKQILDTKQSELIEMNKNVTDSLIYAKRIQKALLPPLNLIKKSLVDSFIINIPKDIVSGDFYWVDSIEISEIKSKKLISKYLLTLENDFVNSIEEEEENEDYIEFESEIENCVLFAVADCTGHGVPGALMSVIGVNSLNKIIKEYKIYTPNKILNELNNEVRLTLRQQSDDCEIKDGMDIALCLLNYSTMKLEFAGANLPLYLIRNNELIVYKGDRFPIGFFNGVKVNSFKNNSIDIQEGDVIYLFSDGYYDQFGASTNKKFNIRRFKELLLSIKHLDTVKQKIVLEKTLKDWQGNTFQVDDILILGVKF